jgi:hypothetical protein
MSEDDFIWGNDFQEEGIFGHVQSSLGNRGEQRAAVQHDKENNSLMLQGSCPTTIPAYKVEDFPALSGEMRTTSCHKVVRWGCHTQSLKDEAFPTLPSSKRNGKKIKIKCEKAVKQEMLLAQRLQPRNHAAPPKSPEHFPLLELSTPSSFIRKARPSRKRKPKAVVRQVENSFNAAAKIERRDDVYFQAKRM